MTAPLTSAMSALLRRCAASTCNVFSTARNQNTARALVRRGLVQLRRVDSRRQVLVITTAGVVVWAEREKARERAKREKQYCQRCGRGVPPRMRGTGFCSHKCHDRQTLEDRASAESEHAYVEGAL